MIFFRYNPSKGLCLEDHRTSSPVLLDGPNLVILLLACLVMATERSKRVRAFVVIECGVFAW